MYKEFLLTSIFGIFLVICVMVGVAFLTLLERKVLGYIQFRKGPNKMGVYGIFQPFCDAIKLFMKEQVFLNYSNYYVYFFSPVISLFLILLIWLCFPLIFKFLSFNLGVLFFLCCLGLGVYVVMSAGWSSNSIYALLGSLRAIAQAISYEVSLVLLIMSLLFLIGGFNLINFLKMQGFVWFIYILSPVGLMWFITSLAETNRIPFDFAEGESELVSGFNVEYSSGGFALIFLAEYASILFMSMLFIVLFMGANLFGFMFFFMMSFLGFLFIWVRGSMPRFRYDKLMYMAWKSFLPISLNFLSLVMGVKIMLFSF